MLKGRHRLLFILIVGWLVAGCGGLRLPQRTAPAADPLTPFRQALLPDQRGLLEQADSWPVYRLRVRVDPQELSLIGSLQLTIPARPEEPPPTEYYLRLYPNLAHYAARMNVDLVTVNGQGAPFTYAASGTAIHLTVPPRAVVPGQPVVIGLQWRVEARSWPDTRYSLFGQGHDVLSLPLFYPILAVKDPRAAEGWRLDIGLVQGDAAFSEIALYQVTVTVPDGYAVASTGSVLSVTRSVFIQGEGSGSAKADSRQWMDWLIASGPVREFALFVSNQFRLIEAQAGDVHINSWYLPGDEVTARAAAEYTAAALRIYSELFGPYPYSELDVVAGPLTYRGMEYPGLFELGVDLYRSHADELEFRAAHEVAHQWWYNLVGNDPVNAPWLDEGLAEYSTYFYRQKTAGQESAERLVTQRWQLAYQAVRDLGFDTVVNQPVSAFLPANYETIVYAKAALFHHALMEQLGEGSYLALLRRYAELYRFRIARPEDFQALVEEAGGKPAAELYRQWILEAGGPTAEEQEQDASPEHR